jgi:hypothetical protein
VNPKLTDAAQKLVLDGIDSSPIKRDGDSVYMQYDSILIVPEKGEESIVRVSFMWHGKAMVYFLIGVDFSAGEALMLAGVDGAQEIKLS